MGDRGPRLLLVTGLPGTGKTCFGNHLRDLHGFEHFDIEATGRLPLPSTIAAWKQSNADVVVTWGFVPGVSDKQVHFLLQSGFTMVWFDGNPTAASKHWETRESKRTGRIPPQALTDQLKRIASANIQQFTPTLIDPFDALGEFKPIEERTATVLALLQ